MREEESERTITLATNLVKPEVKEKEYKDDLYPDPIDIEALNWSPPLLKCLLKGSAKSDLNHDFLVQCIVKATKRSHTTITVWSRHGLGSKFRFQMAYTMLIKT